MPVRQKRSQAQRVDVSPRDIAALRQAIQRGFPWECHRADRKFVPLTLETRLEFLLCYATGIATPIIWIPTDKEPPSEETVLAVREMLNPDICAAEKKYRSIFVGERYQFRYAKHR
jgi:hypothetical protein